ncbi:MAG TPA: aminomethyltransferase family protein [Steroidobacteraceae bacterium]|nr:aminomethyltransferase family protein [Steroidobacteraceae bacterium]
MLTESEPAFRQPLLKSPFHERAREASQVDSFVPWSGYTTVDVFTSVEQEYFAIRNAASLYDLTPMVKYRISGPDATRYLNRLTTRNIGRLSVGRVAYTVWCNDAGQLIDDGTVFRLGETEFRLCTAERQLDWLLDAAIGFEVALSEITHEIAALALQGPTSCAILRAAGIVGVERLRPFEVAAFAWPGCGEVLISRTGFTGDLGYELWMAPTVAEQVWDALLDSGRTRGIRPVGSRALNIARIEAGFLLPNIDFVNAEHTLRVGTARTPLELGLEWLVDFEKGHFNGRRALLEQHRRGAPRRLVGLDVEGNKPAVNALIYAEKSGKNQVGSVTSACWAPTCKRNIAFAILDAPHFAPDSRVWAEIYFNRELAWERRMARARVVERTFFSPERRRATPPRDH